MKALPIRVLMIIAAALAIAASAVGADDAALRPPKGAHVAIVVFEDLQCPMCAQTAPLVPQQQNGFKVGDARLHLGADLGSRYASNPARLNAGVQGGTAGDMILTGSVHPPAFLPGTGVARTEFEGLGGTEITIR